MPARNTTYVVLEAVKEASCAQQDDDALLKLDDDHYHPILGRVCDILKGGIVENRFLQPLVLNSQVGDRTSLRADDDVFESMACDIICSQSVVPIGLVWNEFLFAVE